MVLAFLNHDFIQTVEAQLRYGDLSELPMLPPYEGHVKGREFVAFVLPESPPAVPEDGFRRVSPIFERQGTMRILTIEQLQGLALDSVVGRRDLGRVRLATTQEVDALSGNVGDGNDRGVIACWRSVAIDIFGQPLEVILLGENDGILYATSPVRAFDHCYSRSRTRSGSIYHLENPGNGEPPLSHVLHLCHLLHRWRLGPLLDVPEVQYE